MSERSSRPVVLYSNIFATVLLLVILLILGVPDRPGDRGPAEETPAPAAVSTPAPAEQGEEGPAAQPPPAEAPPPGRPSPTRNPLAGKVIAVDPGHGGSDPGARGVSGRTLEKYNVWFIALDLRGLLEAAGARVVMTRTGDDYVPLPTRVQIAREAGAEVFVSIHNDANPDPRLRGSSSYYFSAEDRVLAEAVQEQLVRTLGSRDIGLFRRAYHVLRNSTMPAVLVEVGFLSNRQEERFLQSPGYRYRAALGIYRGLQQYFAP